MPALRGNFPAKIDDKCRLKIPTAFRTFIEDQHGREVYVTSVRGDSVRIYPMPVWLEIEHKLGRRGVARSGARAVPRARELLRPGRGDSTGRAAS